MHAWTSNAFMRTCRARSRSWKIHFREWYCLHDVDREDRWRKEGRFFHNVKAALWKNLGLRVWDSHPGSHHRPQYDLASYWISLSIGKYTLCLSHKHKTCACVCVQENPLHLCAEGWDLTMHHKTVSLPNSLVCKNAAVGLFWEHFYEIHFFQKGKCKCSSINTCTAAKNMHYGIICTYK